MYKTQRLLPCHSNVPTPITRNRPHTGAAIYPRCEYLSLLEPRAHTLYAHTSPSGGGSPRGLPDVYRMMGNTMTMTASIYCIWHGRRYTWFSRACAGCEDNFVPPTYPPCGLLSGAPCYGQYERQSSQYRCGLFDGCGRLAVECTTDLSELWI